MSYIGTMPNITLPVKMQKFLEPQPPRAIQEIYDYLKKHGPWTVVKIEPSKNKRQLERNKLRRRLLAKN